MAHRGIDIKKIIPEEFKETPYFEDLAGVMQAAIVDPFIDNLNQLMLSRQAGDDVQSETLTVTAPALVHQTDDPFERGSLLVMQDGLNLYIESSPEGTGEIDTLVDAVTAETVGTVNHTNRTISLQVTGASVSTPVDVEIVYLTKYSMDAGTLDSLRQSLGLFIDTTGLTTEEDTRRLIESLPFYYETSHSKRFVQFLGYAANVLFRMEELYCRLNAFPDYGDKYTLAEAQAEGFSQWVHEVELPGLCPCVSTMGNVSDVLGERYNQIYDVYPFRDMLILDDGKTVRADLADNNDPPQYYSNTAVSTTPWLDSMGDRVVFEFHIAEHTNNSAYSVEDFEYFQLGIAITNEERLLQQIFFDSQGRGRTFLKSDSVSIPNSTTDGNTPQSQTYDSNDLTGVRIRQGDTIQIAIDRQYYVMTVGIMKEGSNVVDTYTLHFSTFLKGDIRAYFNVGTVTNNIAVNFRTNARIDKPCTSTEVDPFKMVIPTLPGYVDWCGKPTGHYSLFANDIWYKTSFVSLEYDDEKFFENVPSHVNLFEKITQLFYQLAPIQLVLEAIVAKRSRKHDFKLRGGVFGVERHTIETDNTSVNGVNPL